MCAYVYECVCVFVFVYAGLTGVCAFAFVSICVYAYDCMRIYVCLG